MTKIIDLIKLLFQIILIFLHTYFSIFNKVKTIVIDNYDSFTYNLVRYIHMVSGERPTVVRNDAFNIEYINNFDTIVLSPGPGLPSDAGLMMDVLKKYSRTKKILGVCLGHQAIAEFFGSELKQLKQVKHGVSSSINIYNSSGIYEGVKNSIEVGRYHSWTVDKQRISKELIITAETEDMEIMSIKHDSLPIFGVQYHPESILTTYGLKIIENFLKI